MPGLAFSRDGARLGRGKGYYDTYLEKCLHEQGHIPPTIALAFYQQICSEVPMSQHDRKVDLVLFEDMDT